MASNFIKTSKLERYYVISGDDEFFRGEFIKELLEVFLAGKVDNTSIETFDLGEKEGPPDVSSVIEAASMAPFFSEMKLVVIKEFTKFKKEELERLIKFLPLIPDFSVVVLTTSQEAKKILDLEINSKNIINLSASPSSNIKTWIESYLKEEKKTIEYDVLNYIIEEANSEAAMVKSEIDKILLFIGDRVEITMADFSETRGVNRAFNLDELTEAIATKDEKRAMLVFEKIYPETAPEQIMAFIFYKIKSLYILRYFLNTGDFKKIYKYAYIKDVDKAKIQAKNFAKVPYADIVAIVKEADSKIKLSNRDKAKTIITMMLQSIFIRLAGE